MSRRPSPRAGLAQARALALAIEKARAALVSSVRGLGRAEDVLQVPRQRLDAAADALLRGISRAMRDQAARVERTGLRLAARGPEGALRLMRQRLDGLSARLHPDLATRPVKRRRERLAERGGRLDAALARDLRERRTSGARIMARLSPELLRPSLARRTDRLGTLVQRLEAGHVARLERRRARFDAGAKLLQALSYESVLERGFAVIRDADGGPLTRAGQIVPGTSLVLQLADGRVSAVAGKAERGGAVKGRRRKAAATPTTDAPRSPAMSKATVTPDLFD